MLRRSAVAFVTVATALVGLSVPAFAAEQPVTGVIRDSLGPVAGAGVCLGGAFPVCSSATGADGVFSLPAPDGPSTFYVAPSTFTATRADFPPTSFQFTVSATGPNSAGTITVDRWASVSGRVFRPDGITPVQFANVGLACPNPSMCPQPATTDANGAFTVSRLAPGAVTIEARAPLFNGMLPLWYPSSIGITLASGEDASDRNIALTAGAVVSGVIRNPDGNPVPQGTSVMWKAGFMSMGVPAGTAADGSYATLALPPGAEMTITAGPTSTGHAVTSSPQVLAAATPVTVDLTLGSGGWVLGTVTSSAGGSVAGAFVRLALDGCLSFSCPQASTTTAGDGTYRLPAMAPGGTYTLSVSPSSPFFQTATRPGITLTAGTGRLEDVVLTSETGISVTLTDPNGVAVNGATVNACPTPAMSPCQTAFQFGSGRYLVRPLAPGTYVVNTTVGNATASANPVVVVAGQVTDQPLQLGVTADAGTASGTSGAGGSVFTSGTPSPTNPIVTDVYTPAGATVTITEQAGTGGVSILGQEVVISTGGVIADAGDPYVFTFTLDASAVGDADPLLIDVLRNGTPLEDCAGPVAADPDPCVASRTVLTDGDVIIVARTTQASTWTLVEGVEGGALFDLSGFFSPVVDGFLTHVKSGAVVPLTFAIGGSAGGLDDVLADGTSTSRPVACPGAAPVTGPDTATTGELRYTPESGRYTYAWKTANTARGCHEVTVRFVTGQELTAVVQFRKGVKD